MNKEQFAELLSGRQYRNEITKEEEVLAKNNGLVISFKTSIYGTRFRGLLKSDISSSFPNECEFFIYQNTSKPIGFSIVDSCIFSSKCNLSGRSNIKIKVRNESKKIKEWGDVFRWFEWHYITDLPHAKFDIIKDGELYCRGIIIEKSVIEQGLSCNCQ